MKDLFSTQLIETLQHESPFFLISHEKVLSQFKTYQEHFPGAAIHYAMKANSEKEVLWALYEAGSSFEVASVYELEALIAISVPADRINYGTSVKPVSHIKKFFEYGVKRFAFDSLSELEKIAAVAPGAEVYIRIAVDDTGSVYKFSEKFGTNKENTLPWLQRARDLGLIPCGISFHVGSQATNPLAWAAGVASMHDIFAQLHSAGLGLEILNIGGGFPCAYASTENPLSLAEIAEPLHAELEKMTYKPQIVLEPGRGLIAESSILVTKVIARVERGASTWLFLDAGVYNALFEALAYQGSTRYRVTMLRPSYSGGVSLFALAGPTGDSADVITREASLPHDVDVGDSLVFHDVGAYSMVVSSTFNGFPRPSVHVM